MRADGSIERCENTGFETRTRTECNTVTDTECETVDKVGYRSEIVPQCRWVEIVQCIHVYFIFVRVHKILFQDAS